VDAGRAHAAAVQFFVDHGYYPRYAGASRLILQAAGRGTLLLARWPTTTATARHSWRALCSAETGRLPALQDHIYDFAEAEYLSLIFQGEQP
jgi:hypothetical protein